MGSLWERIFLEIDKSMLDKNRKLKKKRRKEEKMFLEFLTHTTSTTYCDSKELLILDEETLRRAIETMRKILDERGKIIRSGYGVKIDQRPFPYILSKDASS